MLSFTNDADFSCDRPVRDCTILLFHILKRSSKVHNKKRMFARCWILQWIRIAIVHRLSQTAYDQTLVKSIKMVKIVWIRLLQLLLCFFVSVLRITITVALRAANIKLTLINPSWIMLSPFTSQLCLLSLWELEAVRRFDANTDWFCLLLLSSGKVNKSPPRLDYVLWCTWYITVFTLVVTEALLYLWINWSVK